jgi:UDP-N-acetylmuramoylalanine--D-glutamate ligase
MLSKNNYLVIGAARSGIDVALFLSSHQKNVTLADTKDYETLLKDGYGIETVAENNVATIFSRQPSLEEIHAAELIILSPGVPPDIPPLIEASRQGIPVVSEIEFAAALYKGDVLCVTGTNGKTTTTTLLGELLKDFGLRATTAGNIGDPFVNYVENSEGTCVSLEISSFQLDMTKELHPKVAIITNITPDHLDRHKTMENYIGAKAKVFMNMSSSDTLVLNYDDPNTAALAPKTEAKVLFFSTVERNVELSAYLDQNTIIINLKGQTIPLFDKRALHLLGLHNVANVMAASLAALSYGVSEESVRKTLEHFLPVEHRVEFVAEKSGVKYINDSKGTNPEATMTAINAITDGEIILILGGYDKHSDFDELLALVARSVKHIVVLGTTADKIIASAEKQAYTSYTRVSDYAEAVQTCVSLSESGDYVLLSPACASWDMFDNYEVRGSYFKELVNELK